jgi:hypothetical protein
MSAKYPNQVYPWRSLPRPQFVVDTLKIAWMLAAKDVGPLELRDTAARAKQRLWQVPHA